MKNKKQPKQIKEQMELYADSEPEFLGMEKRIEGAPDLVLEILSPSTSQNDKIHKKRQYERFGVNEY